MRVRPGSAGVALLIAASVTALAPVALPTASEVQQARRTPDGKPDLNGIWQALNTANWDLQDHPARAGAVVAVGAVGAVPAGLRLGRGHENADPPGGAAKEQGNIGHRVN